MKRRLIRAAPWIVAVAIIVAILVRFDARVIAANMRAGDWGGLLPFALSLPFVYLALHAIWDTLVFRRMVGNAQNAGSLRYLDIIKGRAGTAVVMIVGYAAGHGAFGVWLAKKAGARARVVAGAVLYTTLCDLAALGIIATLATTLGGADVPPSVRRAAIIVTLASLLLCVVVPAVMPKSRFDLFPVWRLLPAHLALAQILGRALDIGLVVFFTYQGSRAFGLHIPAAAFATYMPIVLLVTSLPFNIGGLGAAQAAWLVFTPWEQPERILAFQLLWQISFAAGILVRGAPFVRRVTADLRTAEAEAEAEANARPPTGDADASRSPDQSL